jgi:hypothetical protein
MLVLPVIFMLHSQSPMKGNFKRIGVANMRIRDLSMTVSDRPPERPPKKPGGSATESCVFSAPTVAIRKSIAHEGEDGRI